MDILQFLGGNGLFLILAIVSGILSNGFLKSTAGFTKFYPTLFCILSIILSPGYLHENSRLQERSKTAEITLIVIS